MQLLWASVNKEEKSSKDWAPAYYNIWGQKDGEKAQRRRKSCCQWDGREVKRLCPGGQEREMLQEESEQLCPIWLKFSLSAAMKPTTYTNHLKVVETCSVPAYAINVY